MAEHFDPRPVSAYILVKADPAAADKLAKRFAEEISGAMVRRVNGAYDILIAVEAEGEEYVTRTLHDEVRPVDGVKDADVIVWYEEGSVAPAHGQELHAADEEEAA